jgi:PmbA protein
MAKEYLEKAEMAVELAQSQGANMSEVYVSTGKEVSIEISNQEVEAMKMAEEYGLGIRVIINGKIGFAYSTDFRESAIKDTVKQAINNAEKTHADEYNILPQKSKSYPKLDLIDQTILDTSIEDKIALAKEIENQARNFDKRIKITESTTYQDAVYNVAVFNSQGIAESYQGAYCGAYAFLVAEENGKSQTGFDLKYSLKYDDIDPTKIGQEAAKKAVRMLGAKELGTQKATVVLDPYVATNFLGVMAPALSAEAAQKGKSIFADKVGNKVSSQAITIIDDGALPGAVVSSPFDGEGVATRETILIKEGILQGFLHNSYTAAKDGLESTGNGIRGSFKGTPEVGITNFYIKPGLVTQEQLLKEINNGLYVTEVMGMHTANPISGDFSVGAAGILIENGMLTTPVRGIAIAGNIIDLLESIDLVSNDLTFFVGRGSPSLRIAEMTISGS